MSGIMRDIQVLLETSTRYKNAILQQCFESKKNTVAYVILKDKPRVLKWFVPGFRQRMKNEYNVLKKGSSKLNIPLVYELDEKNNVLVMNYIVGENLCDIVNSRDTSFDEKKRLMILLADWFIDFHNFFKTEKAFLIRGDSVLRNFILSDKIWGVDFEETRPGKPVEDLAEMCASILSTDPMFTSEKFELCKIFIESYTEPVPGRIINVKDEIAYKLLERIQWRPEKEEILRKYSVKIKKQGL